MSSRLIAITVLLSATVSSFAQSKTINGHEYVELGLSVK